MRAHRPSLLLVVALLAACGGSRSLPGGSGAGGAGVGGEVGTGGDGPGENGGAGVGGASAAGAGGAAAGAGGNSGGGGTAGGAPIAGAGGSAAGAQDAADTLPQGDVAIDTSAAVDTADTGGPAIDFDAGSATCGGATCPRLFPRVAACKPAGACTQQTDGLLIRRCYANGVRIVGMINPLTGSIVATYFNGGAECFKTQAQSAIPPQTLTFVLTNPEGTEIGRGSQGPGNATTLACEGTEYLLTDRSCLPGLVLDDCLPGACL
jgi:hypothetical protein